MSPIVIFGAGGFAAETAAIIEDINRIQLRWHLLGFIDDDPALCGASVMGLPVLGDSSWLDGRSDLSYVIAIGNPHVRMAIANRLRPFTHCSPATLIHPNASMHTSSSLGPGSIVCRGVSITVRVRAGIHTIANLNSTIGHDAVLGDFTTLHPAVNMSGGSGSGECVEVGTGAVFLPGVYAGNGSVIGAGAVVTEDVPTGCVAVGVPAKPIRSVSKAMAS